MTAPPNLRPGMDEDKYRRDARRWCLEKPDRRPAGVFSRLDFVG